MGTNRVQKVRNRNINKCAYNNDVIGYSLMNRHTNLEYKSRVYCKLVKIGRI